MIRHLLCVCFVILIISNAVNGFSNSTSSLLAKLERNYNRHDPPNLKQPTEVKIGFYVNSINEVDDRDNMEITMIMYMRQNWRDPRLMFDPNEVNGQSSIRLPDQSWKRLWIPDIFFRNAVQVDNFETNQEHALMKLNSSGFIWFVKHLKVRFSCPMHLQRYPFDIQLCGIMIESYGYTMDTVFFSWLDHHFQIDHSAVLPRFTLHQIQKFDCSQNYTSGAFPCLEAQLCLIRDSGYYFAQVFLPTILIVIISWFALWMDIEFFPQRLTVICILMLTLFIQSAVYTKDVAQVSYVKALDIWMLLCFLFVFAVLLESAVVMLVGTKVTGQYEKVETTVNRINNPKIARLMDVIARIVFPVLFLLIIIIYFGLYRAVTSC